MSIEIISRSFDMSTTPKISQKIEHENFLPRTFPNSRYYVNFVPGATILALMHIGSIQSKLMSLNKSRSKMDDL